MLDDDESVALDLVMQARNALSLSSFAMGPAAKTLRSLVPNEERRDFIKRVGAHMKTLRAR